MSESGYYAQRPHEEYTPAELQARATELGITNLPPRPWTPRQRQRIESAISQIERRDFIYGGAPSRRRDTPLPEDTMPGRFILQWSIDGPWVDLRSYDTYADAESARDMVMRQYELDFEDLRIVDTQKGVMGRG